MLSAVAYKVRGNSSLARCLGAWQQMASALEQVVGGKDEVFVKVNIPSRPSSKA